LQLICASFALQLLQYGLSKRLRNLMSGMPRQRGLPTVQVYLQMLGALFESCALVSEPAFELALFHLPPVSMNTRQYKQKCLYLQSGALSHADSPHFPAERPLPPPGGMIKLQSAHQAIQRCQPHGTAGFPAGVGVCRPACIGWP
jgi:hypothetical protein